MTEHINHTTRTTHYTEQESLLLPNGTTTNYCGGICLNNIDVTLLSWFNRRPLLHYFVYGWLIARLQYLHC